MIDIQKNKTKKKCGNYIRTPEFRKAMSESSKGRKPWNTNKTLSKEHKQKLSDSHKGKIPWNKGKKGVQNSWKKGLTKEDDPRIKSPNLGKTFSKEWREKLSIARRKRVITEETKDKQRIARLSQVFPKKDSKPEKLMQLALQMEGIKFEKHKKLPGQPDIFIEPNLCIFVDGDFWHGNPDIFKADDVMFGGLKASDIWARDNKITHLLSQQGYEVMRFWTSFIEKPDNKWANHVIHSIKDYVIRHNGNH